MENLLFITPHSCLLLTILEMVAKKYLVSVAGPMAECCDENPKEGPVALPE